jgi:hypothetical protein
MRSPVRQSLDDWYTVLILLEQQNKIRYLQFRQQEEVLAARAPLLLNFRRTLTLSDQEKQKKLKAAREEQDQGREKPCLCSEVPPVEKQWCGDPEAQGPSEASPGPQSNRLD